MRYRSGRPRERQNLDRPLPPQEQPLFALPTSLGRQQGDQLENADGRRLLRRERQLQVTDDPVDDRRLGQESDNLHPPAAAGASERVHFIDLPYHLGPALGRDGPKLLLDHPERNRNPARLPDLPPVGIGIESVIAHRDLALVRNMGSDPGDELQA
jgi:hypothetical protein